MIILDLETDGLLPELTQVFCAVAYDTKTEEFFQFISDRIYDAMCQNVGSPTKGTFPLRDLFSYLDKWPELSCQNGLGFDLKVLKKLYNYEYKGKYLDTVLLSRILWPDLENIQYKDENGKLKTTRHPHSVEAWGLRFGLSKPVIEDYTKYTPNTLHRCREDVKIQVKLYDHIIERMRELSVSDPRIKNGLPLTASIEQRVWRIMEDAADRGWLFDLQKGYELCDELTNTLKGIDAKLSPVLPKKIIQVTKNEDGSTKAFKANGTMTIAALNWHKEYFNDNERTIRNCVLGDFCKVKFEDFNIGSSQQVKNYLIANGWKPKEWNHKKDSHGKPLRDSRGHLVKLSPKVPKTAEDWEEVAQLLDNPNIALLAERNKAAHRWSQIDGLMEHVRMDHRIEAQANTCSTNTARMTHRIVVNIPKADESVYYGHKMRSLFVASPGMVLVGCDASALEARCEAHYIYPYDPKAAQELITGDIHSLNAEIFKVTRQKAKNGKYAILYGCSPAKLATTIDKPVQMAQQIYDNYWAGNPALKQLKIDVEAEYDKWGYLVAIDGRPLTIRYKHALINTLLQSCGSIAVKLALCYFTRAIKEHKLDAHILGVFHDEWQTECPPEQAQLVGELGVDSLRKAGVHLKLNVELTGEFKIGQSWDQTH